MLHDTGDGVTQAWTTPPCTLVCSAVSALASASAQQPSTLRRVRTTVTHAQLSKPAANLFVSMPAMRLDEVIPCQRPLVTMS